MSTQKQWVLDIEWLQPYYDMRKTIGYIAVLIARNADSVLNNH